MSTFPLVKEPELIRVRTINPKIFEQLSYVDGEAGGLEKKLDLTGIEIIGAVGKYGTLLVRKPDGSLWKLRGTALIMDLRAKGKTHEEANAEHNAIPQIFEV